MNKILSIILLLILNVSAIAQISEHYFSDLEQKEGGQIYDHIKYENSIIIGGQSFDTRKYNPSVIRLDTLGNTVWSTNDTATYLPAGGHISKLLVSDGYVYAIMSSVSDYYTNKYKKEIWKIDITDGNILWKKNFYSTYRDDSYEMIDFDADKFLLEYSVIPSSSANIISVNYAFIDKNNGDTLSTHKIIENTYGIFPIAVDSDKNIYYAKGDSIFKVTGNSATALIWKISYSTQLDRTDYQKMYIDSKDSVYLFGVKGDGSVELGRVASINKTTGKRNWEITVPYDATDMKFQDMVDKNGFLYVAWTHIYIGAEKNKAWTSKIDKNTGQQIWFSDFDYQNTIDDRQQSTISLDVDNNGHVYMTGYYGSSNYGPGKWGILKLDGATGNVIYTNTIFGENDLNVPAYIDANIGLVTCVFNNTPYYLGQLLTTYNVVNTQFRTKIAFVKADPLTGDIKIQKFVDEGKYRFPSSTIAIADCPSGQTAVLKQIGRNLTVEMHDAFKNIIWTKVFEKEYALLGRNLIAGPNGNIYFSASSAHESAAFPYYAYPDSTYIYQLSASGDIMKIYTLFEDSYLIYPSQLYADNSRVLFSYLKVGAGLYEGTDVYCYRKIESMQMSNDIYTGFSNRKLSYQISNYFSKDDSKAYYFSNDYGHNYVTEFDKSKMMYVGLAGNLYTPLDTVNYVLKVDETHALICANSKYQRESVGLYDFDSKDTVWTRLFPESYNSYASKAVLDATGEHAYVMSSNNTDITIREISVLNGAQIWEYTYNGTADKEDLPLDIVYDKQREQIIVTGYETMADKTTSALILIIDKDGTPLDTIIKTGDYSGLSFSLCAHVLQDGSQWVGGSLSRSEYGPDGFLYELEGTSVVTGIINKQQDKQNTIYTKVFPNPFSNTTTIEVVSEQKYSYMTLTLYNMFGEIVHQFSQQATASFQINRNGLAVGMYTYQINTENGAIATGKLIVAD